MNINSRKILVFVNGTLFIIVVVVLLSGWKVQKVESQFRRNTGIFNIGWIWSLPYDISNTLRAPLAGPLSLILTAGLSIIMFFGMIVSPVYYLLGTPSRKYHIHDSILNWTDVLDRRRRSFEHDPFDLVNLNLSHRIKRDESEPSPSDEDPEETMEEPASQYPNFMDSLFFFLPEEEESCKKLLLCHSHGYLVHMPPFFLPIYRFFSRKLMGIPDEYQNAVQYGFEDQGSCAQKYSNCSKDLVTIVHNTITHLFWPDDEESIHNFMTEQPTFSLFPDEYFMGM